MKKEKTSPSTAIGTGIGFLAAILASGSLIEGQFKEAFWFLVGGAILMVLIAKFSR